MDWCLAWEIIKWFGICCGGLFLVGVTYVYVRGLIDWIRGAYVDDETKGILGGVTAFIIIVTIFSGAIVVYEKCQEQRASEQCVECD